MLCFALSAHASEVEFIPTAETRIAPGIVSSDDVILAPFCVKPGANRLCQEAIFYKLTARKSKNSRMVRDRFSFESIDKKREYFENGKIYQYTEASRPLSGAYIQKSLELFQGKLEQAGYRVLKPHFKQVNENRKGLVGPWYNYLWFAPISGGLAGGFTRMVVDFGSQREEWSNPFAIKVGISVASALLLYGTGESLILNARANKRSKHYEENLTDAVEALFSSQQREPVRVKDYIFRDVLGFVQSDFWGWYAVSPSEEEL